MSLTLQKAEKFYIPIIEEILQKEKLPYQDIEDENVEIYVLKNDNILLGFIGLEKYDKIAFLRSMVVDEQYRSKGYGKYLVNELISCCRNKNVNDLYLLTCSAEKFFEKLGFKKILREDAPEEIKQTKQFLGLCPCHSTCMHLEI